MQLSGLKQTMHKIHGYLREDPDHPVAFELEKAGEDPLKGMGKFQGPADGKSVGPPSARVRKLINNVLPLMYRVKVTGAEKLPLTGAVVYAYDHPSLVDPLLTIHEVDRDVRSMATTDIFKGPLAKLVTEAGAFPVDRRNPGPGALKHAVSLLKQGIGVAIAPPGTTAHDPKTLAPFHLGVGAAAVMGKADKIALLNEYYHPATQDEGTAKEKAVGYLTAAALTTATLGAAVLGAPALAAVLATAGVTLAGAWLGGGAVNKWLRPPYAINGPVRMLGKIVGGLVGATAAGVAAAATVAAAPVAVPVLALLGGLGVLGLSRAWQQRDIAEVVISDPIDVKAAVAKYGKDAPRQMTIDMHRTMGHVKEQLTGVPYDDSAQKIFEPIVSKRPDRPEQPAVEPQEAKVS